MAKNYLPSSTRYTISPYESHSTSVVNRLSHMNTYGKNCILGSKESLDVELTGDDSTAVINIGKCVIDDVLIELSESLTVDLKNTDNYVNNLLNYETGTAGYYYLCLYYKYILSRTTPTAYIQIFDPLTTSTFLDDSEYLILKVLTVAGNIVTAISDYDPSDVDVSRKYKENYSEFFGSLPTFESSDAGRMIGVSEDSTAFEFYVGGMEEWFQFQLNPISTTSSPSTADNNYPIGMIWINTTTHDSFILSEVVKGVSANWFQLNSISTTTSPSTADNTQVLGTIWINTTTHDTFILAEVSFGVSATWNQLNPISAITSPSTADNTQVLGTIWINTVTNDTFILAKVVTGVSATWNQLNAIVKLVDPTTSDNTYPLGTIWINNTYPGNSYVSNNIFILSNVSTGVSAVWYRLNKVVAGEDPTSADWDYNLGFIWLNAISFDVFIMIDKFPSVCGIWKRLTPIIKTTDPVTTSYTNTQDLGTIWINTTTHDSFICSEIDSGVSSTWDKINEDPRLYLKAYFLI